MKKIKWSKKCNPNNFDPEDFWRVWVDDDGILRGMYGKVPPTTDKDGRPLTLDEITRLLDKRIKEDT